MRGFVLGLALLSIALSDVVCDNSHVFVKMTKVNGWAATEESFEIYDGSNLLYQSPMFEPSVEWSVEYCLNTTTNNQYTLKFKDEYGDGWDREANVMIEGKYNNIFFKGFMVSGVEDTYSLSLYYPIPLDDQWKLQYSTISGTWTEYTYNDSEWLSVTLGDVSQTVSGTQYFRHQFTSLANMAAYEVSLYYRFGIVVYANGVEVYRDNMPEGPVTSSTLSSGSYTAIAYHTFIRPAMEVSATNSILAVELHWSSATGQVYVDFNAYVALLASNAYNDANCFVYPYSLTISGDKGYSHSGAFDFGKLTELYLYGANLPMTLSYVTAGQRPYVNAIHVWPDTQPDNAPKYFTVSAANSATATTWNTLLEVEDMTYTENQFKTLYSYFSGGMYSAYHIYFDERMDSISVYELQLMTCNVETPTSITFDQTTYTFYAKYEDFSIRPQVKEFKDCTINPTPADGLTFTAATCTLSGIVMEPTSLSYTVTSVMNGNTYQGTFSINIVNCAGTLVNVRRTYKTNAIKETFDIKRADTQEVVLAVAEDAGQVNNADWTQLVCLTSNNYVITVGSSYAYWNAFSHLYVEALLAGRNDYEVIIRAKYDSNIGLPTSYAFNAEYAVKGYQNWSYKMGTVPDNWYNTDMSGWSDSASTGSFPDSTNQIQLYKKQFTVNSIQDVAGFVVSLKYRYGVLIYMNGHEAFRLGVTGALSTTSYSSVVFDDANYRQISLPIKTIPMNGTEAVNYITTGTNTIAIALVAPNPQTKISTFDCAVRLMGVESVSRVFDSSITSEGVSGSFRDILNHYCGHNFYYNSCRSNYLEITLGDHRHEWISSLVVGLSYSQSNKHFKQFVFKAKNEDEDEWTTIDNVRGLTWSLKGQHNRIWMSNNKAYNMFRFEDFATGSTTDCSYQVGFIDMRSDATTVDVPPLTYQVNSTSIFKDIEMGEIYPTSYLYKEFTSTPALPAGVNLDAHTGTISGTASSLASSQVYTISAKTFTGTTVSTTISIAVEVCTGGRSLITMVARTDSSPSQSSYKLYKGKGKTGEVLYSVTAFAVANALNYGDFCLQHDFYTLELLDTSNGWTNPAGYYLTIDVGEMKFDMGHVYNGGASPTSVTTMFSSYLPFQIQYDDWKVYKDLPDLPANWNTIDYDDSTWSVVKANEIGTTEAVTVFIRREVNIPDINEYHVLNIRAKYSGGLVCYFNGRKVARFNLGDNFLSSTESLEVLDINNFSQFHVILSTVGAVAGKNVISFEIHRPKEQSSAEPVIFDATGIFGINDCSVTVDSYIDISGSTSYVISSLDKFLDLSPVDYGYLKNSVGSYLQWSVQNLEGTRWNSLGIQGIYDRSGIGFSVYGRTDAEDEEETSMFAEANTSLVQRARVSYSVPVGIAGFRHFRWELDKTSGTYYVACYMFQYCKADGEGTCPGVDDYPAVADGQVSPSVCPDGFRGYSYRECHDGQLGEVKTDLCVHKKPANLRYSSSMFTLVKDTTIRIEAPAYTNIVDRFYLEQDQTLPAGLVLDETTGAITGIPTEAISLKPYKIYGSNPKGVVSVEINLTVRAGECKADGNFPTTVVGETAVFECSAQGNYIGTQKRACKLGAKDGEWQKLEGICVLVPMLVILLIIAIIVIVVVVYIVIRLSRRKKAVGGVKGGKKVPEKSKVEKKPNTKAVKV